MRRRTAILTLVGVMAVIVALCVGLLVWIASGPVSDWVSHKGPARAQSATADQQTRSTPATPSPGVTTKPAAWDASITEKDPMKRAALRGALSMVTWSPARMHSEAEGGLARADLFSSAARKQLKIDAKAGPLQNGEWMQRAQARDASVGSVKLVGAGEGPEGPGATSPASIVTVYATWKWVPAGSTSSVGEWSPWARLFQLRMIKRHGTWVVDDYDMQLVARSDFETQHN